MAVFILLGPEEGSKTEFIKKEREKCRQLYPDMEEYTFFGGDEDNDGITAALSQSSLFSSYRFVIIRHFENVKKTDSIWLALDDFGKRPQDDVTVIVLSVDTKATAFPEEFVALAPKGSNTIVYYELDDYKKEQWIKSYARSQGFNVDKDAITEILSTVDNNTEEMKNLVWSITTFLKTQNNSTRTITLEDIASYSTRTKGEDGYTLFKAMAYGNLEESLMVANAIMLNDQREIVPALSVLASSFRRLEAALQMRKAGKSDDVIFKTVTSLSTYSTGKKVAGIFFKDANTYRKAMSYYTLEDAKRIILVLGKYDKVLKSANSDLTKLTVEKMIYTIVGEKGKETDITLSPPSLSPNYFV